MNAFTMILPTYHREKRIARQLQFYQDQGASFPIIVADSSEDDGVRECIKSYSQVVEYRHLRADVFIVEKLWRTAADIRTPLTVVGADDDFFMPESLSEASQWLATHHDYSLAYGPVVKFISDHGRVRTTKHSPQASVDQDSAMARINQNAVYGGVAQWHAMQRTIDLRRNMELTERVDRRRLHEILPLMLSLIKGKAKCLEVGLWQARESHFKKNPLANTKRAWLEHEDTPKQVRKLIEIVADHGIDATDAMAIFCKDVGAEPPSRTRQQINKIRTYVGRMMPSLADINAYVPPEEFEIIRPYIPRWYSPN